MPIVITISHVDQNELPVVNAILRSILSRHENVSNANTTRWIAVDFFDVDRHHDLPCRPKRNASRKRNIADNEWRSADLHGQKCQRRHRKQEMSRKSAERAVQKESALSRHENVSNANTK